MIKKLNYLLIMGDPCDLFKAFDNKFNLGITYISAIMKRNNFNISTYNLYLGNMGEIEDIIRNKKIDVILLSGLITNVEGLNKMISTAKTINKDIISIVGGGLITSAPIISMKALKIADFGVLNEGEYTIVELCSALENNTPINRIKGIVYKNEEGEYIKNESREDIKDLDSLPLPDREGFRFKDVLEQSAGFGWNVTVDSSRSCPYKCSFCFHTCGQKYRTRSIDDSFKEIDYLIKEYKVSNIMFTDELFTHNIKRLKIFLERIKDYNLEWACYGAVQNITHEIATLLKEAGCKCVIFGIESADNKVLKSMKKPFKLHHIDNALNICADVGLRFEGYLILGDPEEDSQTIRQTINWYKENPRFARFIPGLTPVIPYPGTRIYNVCVERGIIKDEVAFVKRRDLIQGGLPDPIINMSKLSNEEYLDLINYELPQLYYYHFTEIDPKDGHMEYYCKFCNKKHILKNKKTLTSPFLFGCDECFYTFYICKKKNYIEHIENEISSLVETYGEVSFLEHLWILTFILTKSEYLRECENISYHSKDPSILNIFKEIKVVEFEDKNILNKPCIVVSEKASKMKLKKLEYKGKVVELYRL